MARNSVFKGVGLSWRKTANRTLRLSARGSAEVEVVADVMPDVEVIEERDESSEQLDPGDGIASRNRDAIGATQMLGLPRPVRGTYCGLFRECVSDFKIRS